MSRDRDQEVMSGMTPERWEQVERIFGEALERAPEHRSAYLDHACAGDEALRKEVESLLASHAQAESFDQAQGFAIAAQALTEQRILLPAGQQISHYKIIREVGRGGMGEVYLAKDTRLGRSVALKVLPSEFTTNKDRLRRFEQEARTASTLSHPNIAHIYEVGEVEGHRYIAMEYVEGMTLRQRMANGRMKLGEALDLETQAASALSAAHQAGIIHRDIKPENIMLRPDGYIKVLDFGLAKLTERPTTNPEATTRALVKTDPGVVMGTAHYMSPEQARGLAVDARTDVWSLGVVLYEMVTGHTPFEGETTSDVIAKLLEREPAPLTHSMPDAPAELERIIRKALRKDREERYQSAKDLALDLKSLRRELEVEAVQRHSVQPTVSRRAPSDTGLPAGAEAAKQSEVSTYEIGAVHPTTSAEYIVSKMRRHTLGAAAVLAALLAVAGVAYFILSARGSHAAINSVAVLPFVNASNDPNTEYLSDGISESLINSLSQLPQLKVIASSSTFQYKGKEIDPQEVAKALSVQGIVIGRVVQRGDNLLVSAELVNATDKTEIWGERYNRKAADLQAVQEEIVRAIMEKLRLRLTGAQEQRLEKRATQNPEAYQLYLDGQYYFRKGGKENGKKAFDYLNQEMMVWLSEEAVCIGSST